MIPAASRKTPRGPMNEAMEPPSSGPQPHPVGDGPAEHGADQSAGRPGGLHDAQGPAHNSQGHGEDPNQGTRHIADQARQSQTRSSS